MTWHQIEGNCRQFAGDIKDWWGHLRDHEWVPTVIDKTMLAPLRLVHVAKWVSKVRTAVALNGDGEILVFHDKKLAFPKRQACRRYFASETIVTPLAGRAPVKISIHQVREAMGGMSLGKASATRSTRRVGATQRDGHAIDAGTVSEDGALAFCPSRKIARLRRILGVKRYPHDLDTPLRQEIDALDGATVLTLDGEVLAARAILLIRNGHSGNGHQTTEESYDDSNIRIKINDDGYLQVFACENEGPLVSFG